MNGKPLELPELREFNPVDRPPKPWTDEAIAKLLAGLSSGRSLFEILRTNPELPNYRQYSQKRRDDADFAAKIDEARELGMELRLDEALDHQFRVREHKELSIAAQKYADVTVKMAEKHAPKRYGPMIKHAGHDGNALTVQTISWKDGGTLVSADHTPMQDECKPMITGKLHDVPGDVTDISTTDATDVSQIPNASAVPSAVDDHG